MTDDDELDGTEVDGGSRPTDLEVRMPSACLSLSDRNLLLQIERNAVRRFDPGNVSHLVQRGLVEISDGLWTLTRAGRLAVNGDVAREWRAHMSTLVPDVASPTSRRA